MEEEERQGKRETKNVRMEDFEDVIENKRIECRMLAQKADLHIGEVWARKDTNMP